MYVQSAHRVHQLVFTSQPTFSYAACSRYAGHYAYVSDAILLHNFKQNIVNAVCGIYASYTVIGRGLSGAHWITDIVGGIMLSTALVMLYYSINKWADSNPVENVKARA